MEKTNYHTPGQNTFIEPSERVELYFSARNLKKMDMMSNTDCKIVLYSKNPTNQQTQLIDETETINNNLNPDFTKSFVLDYFFERHQHYYVKCLDVENSAGTKYEDIGAVEFELGSVVGSRQNMVILDIVKKGKTNGKLVIRTESVAEGPQLSLECQLRGLKLTNFGLIFNRIKPYLTISKPKLNNVALKKFASGDADIESLKAGNWITVYQSGKVKKENPLFPLLKIRQSKLCGDNMENPIKV